MILDENLRKSTGEKGRCSFFILFCKKIKNFEEHSNLNEKIKKNYDKKLQFLYFVEFF